MRKESTGYLGMALAVLVTVGVVVTVFLSNSRPPSSGDKPQVAATIPPIAMVLREVAGDRVEVVSILKAGDSPHSFSFTPSTRKEIADAAGLVSVGEGLDTFAESLEHEKHLILFPHVPAKLRLHAAEHDHGEGEEHHHDHGTSDPHFWLSTRAIRAVLPSMVEMLSEIDPEGKETFETNAANFERELGELQGELLKSLKPLKASAFVQHHPSFNYFMKEFYIQDGGVVELNPAAGVGAKHKADLLEELKKSYASGIFVEPQIDPKHAQEISKESGVPLIEVDPLGGVEGRNTYQDLMRYNAKQMIEKARKP